MCCCRPSRIEPAGLNLPDRGSYSLRAGVDRVLRRPATEDEHAAVRAAASRSAASGRSSSSPVLAERAGRRVVQVGRRCCWGWLSPPLPTTRTRPSWSRVAVWPSVRRAHRTGLAERPGRPGRRSRRSRGSPSRSRRSGYEARMIPPARAGLGPVRPPAMRTRPSASSVAVCCSRGRSHRARSG